MPALAPRRRFALAAATSLLLLGWSVGRAAEPGPADTALGKVPADAEAFSANLRLGETIAIIAKSRAWQSVWNEPAVQDLWKKARAAYDAEDGELSGVRKFYQAPANRDLPGLVFDAISNEVFVYAGAGWGEKIEFLQHLYGEALVGPLVNKAVGMADSERAQVRAVLKALSEKPKNLHASDLVIGFKVSDPAKVAAQLKRLDGPLADALKDTPLKGHAARETIDGDEFLVFKLDASLVPWDQLDLKKYEDEKDEFAPLLKQLKATKLAVSVGVRKGYLLLAVGESTAAVAKFGGAGPKLAARPEFQPLARYAGKPYLAVSYLSQKLLAPLATKPEDFGLWVEAVRNVLEQADLSEPLNKAILKDTENLVRGLWRDYKIPGAVTVFSFRTSRGWETYARDYTEPGKQAARPLTLLNHLGGNPLLAAVGRNNTTAADYRASARWVAKFADHAQKALIEKLPQAEEGVKLFQEQFVPVIQELSDVTEKLWYPALADGQEAFVLDAKWTSQRWHAAMPESDKPLPLLELGIVLGVSDAAKLQEALEGYRGGINKLIAKVRDVAPPGTVPPFEIPKPQAETKDGNTFAHYPIPELLGLDARFQPTGGLSKTVAVLTLSREHAERLLKDTPLKAGTAPLADPNKPLDSVFYFNWAGVVDTVSPWVNYAMKMGAPGDEPARIARKATGLLKVFQSYTSATYREGGATVTHGETVFKDVADRGK